MDEPAEKLLRLGLRNNKWYESKSFAFAVLKKDKYKVQAEAHAAHVARRDIVGRIAAISYRCSPQPIRNPAV